jgi:hypothetical protein
MKLKHRYERWLIVLFAFALFSPSAVRVVTGGGGGGLSARAQFQRQVDSPGAGPFGTLTIAKKGSKQSIDVDLRDLPGESFALFIGEQNTFDTDTVFFVASLDKRTNDHWVLSLDSEDGFAPVQVRQFGFDDVEDLAGLFLFVSNPAGTTNIVCDTNTIVCITNDLAQVICSTNCTTNAVVGSVLATQIPVLTNSTSGLNFKGKVDLTEPLIPPSQGAKGRIFVKFNAKQGRSILKLDASGLPGGQVYSLCISNATTAGFTNIAQVTTTTGSKFSFRRDTKRGEMLPLLSPSVVSLSGTVIQIKDAFNEVHLEGVFP